MNSAAILCALLLLAPPDSNWERFVSTPKVFRSDHPKAHPLAYFRLEPCARKDDAPTSECVSGTPDTQRRLVGRIHRFMVYDLDTYFSAEADPDAVERKVDRRSILVQSGPGQFHEIYMNEMASPNAVIYPTEFVKAGRIRILVSKSDAGGSAGNQYLAAFLILPNGSVHLDFTPVYEAGKKLVPQGQQLWIPASGFDFEKLEWISGTNTDHGGKIGCCVGQVTVKFEIEPNGIVTAGTATFKPSPPQNR